MNLRLRLFVSWGLVVLYMGAIFFFSAQLDLSVPYGFSHGDFVLHMVEYGVLGFLLSWALVNSGIEKRLVLYVLLAGFFYGVTDEIHQYFVPNRNASLLDVIADGLGCLIGVYAFHLVRSVRLRAVIPSA